MLIGISVLLLLPNFFNIHLEKTPQYDHKELFNPGLAYINSTEKLIEVSDSTAKQNNIPQNTLAYAITVSKILRNRFYHGFSRYPLNQNWIAATGEYFLGYGLASIVNPDDILKYSFGGCSQQSIVLTEVMKRKNISYRKVGFPHHYATELRFNNNWYFFDPNMEPNIPDSDRLESKWKCCGENLKKYYDTSRFKNLDWAFGKDSVTFGIVNAVPAPNATLFHTTTKYLSKTLWLFPLVIVFYRRKKVSTGLNFLPITINYF
ncbi:MAG: hypothetical protein JWN83_1652 [Chitinophagaceae bacterium]|nr:hypothetical protein [Chitinophagaceae bacterium]